MKISKSKVELIMARNCLEMRELVNTSGLAKITVQRMLAGKDVKPVTIGKIAKALEIDVQDIVE